MLEVQVCVLSNPTATLVVLATQVLRFRCEVLEQQRNMWPLSLHHLPQYNYKRLPPTDILLWLFL